MLKDWFVAKLMNIRGNIEYSSLTFITSIPFPRSPYSPFRLFLSSSPIHFVFLKKIKIDHMTISHLFSIPKTVLAFIALCLSFGLQAQNTSNHGNKFEPIDQMIAGPNNFRGMDGAPGPNYWQQQCDYDIDATLNVEEQRLDGKETLTYYNNSPNTLKYLWLQLDENQFSKDNTSHRFDPSTIKETMSELDLQALEAYKQMGKHGVNIEAITDTKANPLTYRINNTMMRVELPQPLAAGEKFSFVIKWHYYIVDRVVFSQLSNYAFSSYPRGGYEYFPEDGNYLFTITQWFPRMCAYTDLEGWQNQQFTGRSEFALTFGNYDVRMTVPSDYIVGSTGDCQNYEQMLTPTQLTRYRQSQTAKEPLKIVTLEEAVALESAPKSKITKTWVYRAENVRDFAWTASRKICLGCHAAYDGGWKKSDVHELLRQRGLSDL